MSQNFHDATPALGIRVPRSSPLLGWVASAAAELRDRLARARARRTVRELDETQLADAGIDASAFLPQRPTIAIEPGLMTRLMTMR